MIGSTGLFGRESSAPPRPGRLDPSRGMRRVGSLGGSEEDASTAAGTSIAPRTAGLQT
jgi:hypothetical protein